MRSLRQQTSKEKYQKEEANETVRLGLRSRLCLMYIVQPFGPRCAQLGTSKNITRLPKHISIVRCVNTPEQSSLTGSCRPGSPLLLPSSNGIQPTFAQWRPLSSPSRAPISARFNSLIDDEGWCACVPSGCARVRREHNNCITSSCPKQHLELGCEGHSYLSVKLR